MAQTGENMPPAEWPESIRPRGLVILIHGTWARGRLRVRDFKSRGAEYDQLHAPWMHEGSHFRRRLTNDLPSHIDWQIERFDWCGSNSVRKRHVAAFDLMRRLRAADQFHTLLIVGHSHGGTIAFDALTRLKSSRHHVMLVTLATPFLSCYLDTRDAGIYWFSTYFLLTSGAFLSLGALFGGGGLGELIQRIGDTYGSIALLGLVFGVPVILIVGAKLLSPWLFGVSTREVIPQETTC